MQSVFRIAKENYISDLSGKGAKEYGGRWNSVGNSMLYTSENISLCLLEVLCNVQLELVQQNLALIELQLPKTNLFDTISLNDLPKDWYKFPAPYELNSIGDKFLKEGKFLGLKVPSAIVTEEHNILLNPLHSMFKEVKIIKQKKYVVDNRLYAK